MWAKMDEMKPGYMQVCNVVEVDVVVALVLFVIHRRFSSDVIPNLNRWDYLPCAESLRVQHVCTILNTQPRRYLNHLTFWRTLAVNIMAWRIDSIARNTSSSTGSESTALWAGVNKEHTLGSQAVDRRSARIL